MIKSLILIATLNSDTCDLDVKAAEKVFKRRDEGVPMGEMLDRAGDPEHWPMLNRIINDVYKLPADTDRDKYIKDMFSQCMNKEKA